MVVIVMLGSGRMMMFCGRVSHHHSASSLNNLFPGECVVPSWRKWMLGCHPPDTAQGCWCLPPLSYPLKACFLWVQKLDTCWIIHQTIAMVPSTVAKGSINGIIVLVGASWKNVHSLPSCAPKHSQFPLNWFPAPFLETSHWHWTINEECTSKMMSSGVTFVANFLLAKDMLFLLCDRRFLLCGCISSNQSAMTWEGLELQDLIGLKLQ